VIAFTVLSLIASSIAVYLKVYVKYLFSYVIVALNVLQLVLFAVASCVPRPTLCC
jgi:hypothetical protein